MDRATLGVLRFGYKGPRRIDGIQGLIDEQCGWGFVPHFQSSLAGPTDFGSDELGGVIILINVEAHFLQVDVDQSRIQLELLETLATFVNAECGRIVAGLGII